MERSRGPSRRAWPALGIGTAAAAAVGGTLHASTDDPVPDRERVRTDVAPLRRRFGGARRPGEAKRPRGGRVRRSGRGAAG
ncbi:hypothetical protein [Streptomyces sp. NPDC001880]